MKMLMVVILLVVSLGLGSVVGLPVAADASTKGSHRSRPYHRSTRASGKTVHVRTYTKKNGTIVHSHNRRPARR
jgi:hypothetical protein